MIITFPWTCLYWHNVIVDLFFFVGLEAIVDTCKFNWTITLSGLVIIIILLFPKWQWRKVSITQTRDMREAACWERGSKPLHVPIGLTLIKSFFFFWIFRKNSSFKLLLQSDLQKQEHITDTILVILSWHNPWFIFSIWWLKKFGNLFQNICKF
jgi:hypothetical protein